MLAPSHCPRSNFGVTGEPEDNVAPLQNENKFRVATILS